MDLGSLAPLHPTFDADLGLLWLDLDHGKANEVGTEQLLALERLCELVEEHSEIRSLCTTSRRVSPRGKAIFIAGANVTERMDWDDQQVKQHVIRQRDLMRRIRHLPIFTMVVTHGVTLGWGCEYLLTADYTVATAGATVGLPETGLGILPGARGTAELASVVGPPQALRLGCTGETVDAHAAHSMGLVQEVVAGLPEAEARILELARAISRRSAIAIAAYKSALLSGLGMPETARLKAEQAAYERCVDSGEAALGRANFAAIRKGEAVPWGPRRQ